MPTLEMEAIANGSWATASSVRGLKPKKKQQNMLSRYQSSVTHPIALCQDRTSVIKDVTTQARHWVAKNQTESRAGNYVNWRRATLPIILLQTSSARIVP